MTENKPHTSIQCLTAIAQHHGLPINPEWLIQEYALGEEEPSSIRLVSIASEIGLKAKADKISWDKLVAQTGVFPLMARLGDGHSVIVVGVQLGGDCKVAILDPSANAATIKMLDMDQFCQHWLGDVIFLKRAQSFTAENQPFGFRWFIPEILKQKAAFRDIAIAAITMQFLALASPIFFQLVIDKVLVHQSASTLWVLGVGVTIALIFDALFGYLRQLLTLAATNKAALRR